MYKNKYLKFRVDYFYLVLNNKLGDSICYLVYKVLNFLIKIILGETITIKLVEIKQVYKEIGYKKLADFFRSFVVACIYEYISVNYIHISYIFSYKTTLSSTHEKKQYIVGLINDKNWNKFMDSKTISIFFDIYKASNNKQISEYIEYQINRCKFLCACMFSTWSIVDYLEITSKIMYGRLMIPIIYFYFLKDIWVANKILYIILSLLCLLPINDYVLLVILFSIKPHYYIVVYKYIVDNNINFWVILVDFLVMLFIYSIGTKYIISVFFILLAYLCNIYYLVNIIIYVSIGMFSEYNIVHMIKIFVLSMGLNLLFLNNSFTRKLKGKNL
jgi:hypothetical protein